MAASLRHFRSRLRSRHSPARPPKRPLRVTSRGVRRPTRHVIQKQLGSAGQVIEQGRSASFPPSQLEQRLQRKLHRGSYPLPAPIKACPWCGTAFSSTGFLGQRRSPQGAPLPPRRDVRMRGASPCHWSEQPIGDVHSDRPTSRVFLWIRPQTDPISRFRPCRRAQPLSISRGGPLSKVPWARAPARRGFSVTCNGGPLRSRVESWPGGPWTRWAPCSGDGCCGWFDRGGSSPDVRSRVTCNGAPLWVLTSPVRAR
jgi:hypothetical protein